VARIDKVELQLVDIPPKVKRTDAIQSFVSQETPIVAITDCDGAVGVGYSYTIGAGGPSIMRLLADHLAPLLIGRDAERVEAIWHELEFAIHATTIGAISALALAAIDTALWDLRCKKRGLPLWIVAGGAADRRPLYTTEGGWLRSAACRYGSSPAAPPTAARSTRPRAAGCISKRERWSMTLWPPASKASLDRRSRSAARMWRRTTPASQRYVRRSARTMRS
jgi:L-alanine-DL-glutamate epimerase-like enolase superfamily enzyme